MLDFKRNKELRSDLINLISESTGSSKCFVDADLVMYLREEREALHRSGEESEIINEATLWIEKHGAI